MMISRNDREIGAELEQLKDPPITVNCVFITEDLINPRQSSCKRIKSTGSAWRRPDGGGIRCWSFVLVQVINYGDSCGQRCIFDSPWRVFFLALLHLLLVLVLVLEQKACLSLFLTFSQIALILMAVSQISPLNDSRTLGLKDSRTLNRHHGLPVNALLKKMVVKHASRC